MDVYILRHGKAGRHLPGGNDSSRALTEKGKEEIDGIAEWMASLEISFDIIATSPLARASETGAIIAAGLGHEKNIETWPSLSIGGDPVTICQKITEEAAMSSLLLVGHEPTLSSLIGLIISGNESAGILLAKGGLARLRDVRDGMNGRDIPGGELQWLLTPRQVLSMKRTPEKKNRH